MACALMLVEGAKLIDLNPSDCLQQVLQEKSVAPLQGSLPGSLIPGAL